MSDETPRPPSRLHMEHDDGTVSAWKRDRLHGTTRIWDRARIFICEIDDGSGDIPPTPEDELDLWGETP